MEEGRASAEVHVEGSLYMGGQEHFYLETNASVAIPTDNNCLEIYSSTQNITESQIYVSSVLDIPSSKIKVTCRRMGGAFGGKSSLFLGH
jgi:xanthine dehydrogenase/oxidase